VELDSVLAGLRFVGLAEGSHQTYYVYAGKDQFVLLSASKSQPNSGRINVISQEAVLYVHQLAAGQQGVVAKDIFERSRRPGLIGSDLDVLHALYVLCATGQARKDNRFKRRALVFNVRAT